MRDCGEYLIQNDDNYNVSLIEGFHNGISISLTNLPNKFLFLISVRCTAQFYDKTIKQRIPSV